MTPEEKTQIENETGIPFLSERKRKFLFKILMNSFLPDIHASKVLIKTYADYLSCSTRSIKGYLAFFREHKLYEVVGEYEGRNSRKCQYRALTPFGNWILCYYDLQGLVYPGMKDSKRNDISRGFCIRRFEKKCKVYQEERKAHQEKTGEVVELKYRLRWPVGCKKDFSLPKRNLSPVPTHDHLVAPDFTPTACTDLTNNTECTGRFGEPRSEIVPGSEMQPQAPGIMRKEPYYTPKPGGGVYRYGNKPGIFEADGSSDLHLYWIRVQAYLYNLFKNSRPDEIPFIQGLGANGNLKAIYEDCLVLIARTSYILGKIKGVWRIPILYGMIEEQIPEFRQTLVVVRDQFGLYDINKGEKLFSQSDLEAIA